MKQLISENDYEKYKIYVPLKLFMTGKQRKYVSNQLEKLHPCFSDNFCFDSKYRVSKKGLCANVVVMDKLRLGEYKANYPGVTLTCEEKGEGGVFVDKKKKAFITILCCVPLFAVLLVPMVLKNDAKQKNEFVSQTKVETTTETKAENTSFAYETFFDLILVDGLTEQKSQNVRIESLSWKYDGFVEQLSVSVADCYPDAFSYPAAQNVSFSNINYANDMPSFSMNVVNRKVADFTDVSSSEDFLDYRSKIRAVLKENEIKLINESYLPFKIRFQISEKDVQKKVLSSIENVAVKSGLCVREVDLNVSGNDVLDVEICFSNDFSYKANQSASSEQSAKSYRTLLSCVENGWDFFDVKKSKSAGEKKSQIQNNIRVIAMSGGSPREAGDRKIGTIIHADGNKVDFFKTAKGVIRNE